MSKWVHACAARRLRLCAGRGAGRHLGRRRTGHLCPVCQVSRKPALLPACLHACLPACLPASCRPVSQPLRPHERPGARSAVCIAWPASSQHVGATCMLLPASALRCPALIVLQGQAGAQPQHRSQTVRVLGGDRCWLMVAPGMWAQHCCGYWPERLCAGRAATPATPLPPAPCCPPCCHLPLLPCDWLGH